MPHLSASLVLDTALVVGLAFLIHRDHNATRSAVSSMSGSLRAIGLRLDAIERKIGRFMQERGIPDPENVEPHRKRQRHGKANGATPNGGSL